MYFSWFDDSKRPLGVKINAAIDAYVARLHRNPAVLLVNSLDAEEAKIAASKSLIVVAHPVIRRHYLGLADTVQDLAAIGRPKE